MRRSRPRLLRSRCPVTTYGAVREAPPRHRPGGRISPVAPWRKCSGHGRREKRQWRLAAEPSIATRSGAAWVGNTTCPACRPIIRRTCYCRRPSALPRLLRSPVVPHSAAIGRLCSRPISRRGSPTTRSRSADWPERCAPNELATPGRGCRRWLCLRLFGPRSVFSSRRPERNGRTSRRRSGT
jgi:hypothetical protein